MLREKTSEPIGSLLIASTMTPKTQRVEYQDPSISCQAPKRLKGASLQAMAESNGALVRSKVRQVSAVHPAYDRMSPMGPRIWVMSAIDTTSIFYVLHTG